MPRFAARGALGPAGRIEKPEYIVYRSKRTNAPAADPFIRCTGYTENHGGGGCSCALEMPRLKWDQHFGSMKDAQVALWWNQSASYSATGDPNLLAYVNVDSANFNKSTSTVSFTATSIAPRLSKCIIGLDQGTNVVEFKNRVKGSTEAIGEWTPSKVLRRLYSHYIGSFWKSKFKLGDTDVLDEGWKADTAPDFIFTNDNFLSAIEFIMGNCGDVYFKERFTASYVTYLDFHRVSRPRDGNSNIIVCRPGQHAIDVGANAETIENSASTDQVFTRVAGVGDKMRYQITVSVESEDAPLRRMWDTSSTVVYTDDNDVTYTAEELVKHDANLAKGERTPDSFTLIGSRIDDVYRKYALPVEVLQFCIAKDNAVKNSLGQRMKIQVLKVARTLEESESGPYLAQATDAYMQEVRSVDLHLDEGYIITGEPMLNVVGILPGPEGGAIREYEEAEVMITLTLEPRPLIEDTGQNGAVSGSLDYPWATDGETMFAPNEQCEYAQLTSNGLDMSFNGGANPHYGCIYQHPDTGVWVSRAYGSPLVLYNDTAKLRAFARSVLRERSKPNRSYEVTIPWLTRSFPLGSKTLVSGQQNFTYDTYAVAGASFDLVGNTTRLSIHSVTPPHRDETPL